MTNKRTENVIDNVAQNLDSLLAWTHEKLPVEQNPHGLDDWILIYMNQILKWNTNKQV